MSLVLDCASKRLTLDIPQVMGILNVTPDSFFDGGYYTTIEKAVLQAGKMQEEGAAIIDIGGESTRPGAKAVSAQEEIDRTVPVIEAINANLNTIISIDTNKPEVMRAAVKAGATFINDVSALRTKEALNTVKELGVAVCLMHMQGEPRTMQNNPQYENVVAEVKQFLHKQVNQCLDFGIRKDRIVIDPGFGFGKTVKHNMALIKYLAEFNQYGVPVLVGVSRKSTIGAILNKPVADRLYGSLALTSLACSFGAKIIRTHDVAPTIDTINICQAVQNESQSQTH